MKKVIKIIIIVIVIVLAITFAVIKSLKDKPQDDYTNSIYVITESGHGINYYEINNLGKLKATINFEPDLSSKYIFKNCYTSHIDVESGKILNEYKEDTCTKTDDKDNKIELDDTLKDILNKATNYVYPINNVSVLKVNDHYYVIIDFSINEYNPYKLYYYEKDKPKLKHIYTFNKENVIGIKEKDKFIFEN